MWLYVEYDMYKITVVVDSSLTVTFYGDCVEGLEVACGICKRSKDGKRCDDWLLCASWCG